MNWLWKWLESYSYCLFSGLKDKCLFNLLSRIPNSFCTFHDYGRGGTASLASPDGTSLLQKAYCRSCTYSNERFTSAFEGLWANGGIDPKQKLGTSLSKLLKLVNWMKAEFLFVGLNLSAIVQEKTPETCTFHEWCFKNKKHYNIYRLTFACCLPHIKICGYRTWLHSWFVFDLIHVVQWLSVAVHFISNWPNLNWLSQYLA